MNDPSHPVTDDQRREAWSPPQLTSEEDARRWAWATVLQELADHGAELAGFDFLGFEHDNGRPKTPRELTPSQRRSIVKATVSQNVVFMDKSCRSKGPQWDYTLAPIPQRNAALKIVASAGLAEAARKLKKETKEEKAARLARELDELGLRAVPK